MKYTPRNKNDRDEESVLLTSLEPVAKGLGLGILELSLSRHKGRGNSPAVVQLRITVIKDGNMGVDDCSRFHRAIMPRLDLAFPGIDLNVEVSSPGINRLIKDGNEMFHYTGRIIKCYRSAEAVVADSSDDSLADSVADGSGWIEGKLLEADGKGVVLETANGKIVLPYEAIAKAKLSDN